MSSLKKFLDKTRYTLLIGKNLFFSSAKTQKLKMTYSELGEKLFELFLHGEVVHPLLKDYEDNIKTQLKDLNLLKEELKDLQEESTKIKIF